MYILFDFKNDPTTVGLKPGTMKDPEGASAYIIHFRMQKSIFLIDSTPEPCSVLIFSNISLLHLCHDLQEATKSIFFAIAFMIPESDHSASGADFSL